MKEEIFFGPQIKQLLEDHDFSTKLNAIENVCRNFLRKEKAGNYSDTVQKLISSYRAMGCNMSLKLHFLHSHLGFFLKTWDPSPINMAKLPSRHFQNGRELQWKMESKCVG
jgi:hypothetical protein